MLAIHHQWDQCLKAFGHPGFNRKDAQSRFERPSTASTDTWTCHQTQTEDAKSLSQCQPNVGGNPSLERPSSWCVSPANMFCYVSTKLSGLKTSLYKQTRNNILSYCCVWMLWKASSLISFSQVFCPFQLQRSTRKTIPYRQRGLSHLHHPPRVRTTSDDRSTLGWPESLGDWQQLEITWDAYGNIIWP